MVNNLFFPLRLFINICRWYPNAISQPRIFICCHTESWQFKCGTLTRPQKWFEIVEMGINWVSFLQNLIDSSEPTLKWNINPKIYTWLPVIATDPDHSWRYLGWVNLSLVVNTWEYRTSTQDCSSSVSNKACWHRMITLTPCHSTSLFKAPRRPRLSLGN